MANEISVLVDASLNNGKVSNLFSPGSVSINQSTAMAIDFIQNIGTTEEAIVFTDFTSVGWVFPQNFDSTNYVEWGLTGSYVGRLSVNDPPVAFRLNTGATLYLKANTAACDVHIVGYDA